MKSAIFHRRAIDAIRSFSDNARCKIGNAIRDLQRGIVLAMPISKPMSSLGMGVGELRVRDRDGIYRTFYYCKSKDRILIFHAFVKKTQKTPQHEIEIGKQRLREMLYEEES